MESKNPSMLNEKEIEVIEYMDYQITKNGIDGWLNNRVYEKSNEFTRILSKRNSEIDQKVSSIFVRATFLGLCQRDGISLINNYETDLSQCEEQYKQIGKSFMGSYGL